MGWPSMFAARAGSAVYDAILLVQQRDLLWLGRPLHRLELTSRESLGVLKGHCPTTIMWLGVRSLAHLRGGRRVHLDTDALVVLLLAVACLYTILSHDFLSNGFLITTSRMIMLTRPGLCVDFFIALTLSWLIRVALISLLLFLRFIS